MDLLDDPGGIAGHDRAGRDIARDDGSGTDQGECPDHDAGQEGGIRADLRPRFDGRSLEALLHGGTLRVWCVGEDGTWSDPAVAHEVRELGDEGLRVDPRTVVDGDVVLDHGVAADADAVADGVGLAEEHAVAALEATANGVAGVDHGVRPDDGTITDDGG